jgi:hypothetical protein
MCDKKLYIIVSGTSKTLQIFESFDWYIESPVRVPENYTPAFLGIFHTLIKKLWFFYFLKFRDF